MAYDPNTKSQEPYPPAQPAQGYQQPPPGYMPAQPAGAYPPQPAGAYPPQPNEVPPPPPLQPAGYDTQTYQQGQPMYGTQPAQPVMYGNPPPQYYPADPYGNQPQQVIVVESQVPANPDHDGTEKQTGQTQRTVYVFTRAPMVAACFSCGKSGTTRVARAPGLLVFIFCVILLFVFWPLSCVPLCCVGCYDVTHYCSYCGAVLGRKTGL